MTQTAIPSTGTITCPECGVPNEIQMGDDRGFATCSCGKRLRCRHHYPEPIGALEACGYRLSVDWDGGLLVDSDDEPPEEVRKWLFFNQCELRSTIEYVGKAARACFMGGSKNGERHGRGIRPRYGQIEPVHVHIGRSHWETYEFRDRNDPRLFFVGRSTSKAKAKQGVFVPTGKRGE
ncbi:hypothetical protein LCGC14_0249710 [marine sediment metagenome]|uniref:Uncharacterized protein n=1 Tax=marine sediment metagenome TaxID=412755 RepID=A0A0F9X9W0_9ZZZZ